MLNCCQQSTVPHVIFYIKLYPQHSYVFEVNGTVVDFFGNRFEEILRICLHTIHHNNMILKCLQVKSKLKQYSHLNSIFCWSHANLFGRLLWWYHSSLVLAVLDYCCTWYLKGVHLYYRGMLWKARFYADNLDNPWHRASYSMWESIILIQVETKASSHLLPDMKKF